MTGSLVFLLLRNRLAVLGYQALLLHHSQTFDEGVEIRSRSSVGVEVRVGPGEVLRERSARGGQQEGVRVTETGYGGQYSLGRNYR